MIVTQTPLRISLAGGGSDLPAWYMQEEGAVLSFTIDKYVYVMLNEHFDGHVRLSYSETENTSGAFELKHDIVRNCLKKMEVETGVEIVTVADVPGRGTGLGSSSALAVGLLNALHYRADSRITIAKLRRVLAEDAFEVEAVLCRKSVGKQDHFAAAYGGINFMEFSPDWVKLSSYWNISQKGQLLEENLLLFYTGLSHDSEEILSVQKQGLHISPRIRSNTRKMVDLARWAQKDLTNAHVDNIGKIMHEGWMLKKEMADGVSNPTIDEMYSMGLACGAQGGKLLGAGGGGFLLFAVKPWDKEKFLSRYPLKPMPFKVTDIGSQALFRSV